jgi:hypothetical protein
MLLRRFSTCREHRWDSSLLVALVGLADVLIGRVPAAAEYPGRATRPIPDPLREALTGRVHRCTGGNKKPR